jgi:hypothetical protein
MLAQTLFQDSVANNLKSSLSELSKIKNASSTTLDSLKEVADDQRTTLNSLNQVADGQKRTLLTTRRGLNPLLPVEIGLSYQLNIDSIVKSHSHKEAIYYFLNKLKYYKKESLLELRRSAGDHWASSVDTTNINFNPMVIPEMNLLGDQRFREGRTYFAALLPTSFTMEIKNLNANKSTNNQRIIGFDILAKELGDTKGDQQDFELSSSFDAQKKSLDVEIWPINPYPHVNGFVSLYDLENSFISLSKLGSRDGRVSNSKNSEWFKLNYITINTGYQLTKKIELKFTERDRRKDNIELYSRLITSADLK